MRHIADCLGVTPDELEELAGIYERSPHYAANERRRVAGAEAELRDWQMALLTSAIAGTFGDLGKDAARDYTSNGNRTDARSLELFAAEMQKLSASGRLRRAVSRGW